MILDPRFFMQFSKLNLGIEICWLKSSGVRGTRGNFGRGPTGLQNVNPFSLIGIPTELVHSSIQDVTQAQDSGHLRFESSQETNICGP